MMNTSQNIKEPGLNILPPGVERYVVNGGGLTGFQVFPDDELEILNNEGNQICEIIVFNNAGNSEPAILNLKESKSASEIKKILLSKDESSKIEDVFLHDQQLFLALVLFFLLHMLYFSLISLLHKHFL